MGKEKRRYSLRAQHGFEKDFTVLHRRKFLFKRLEKQGAMKVSLWNVQPPHWPGTAKAKLDMHGLAKMVQRMYDRSQHSAHLVLWQPMSELHESMLHPLDDVGGWMAKATILSGDTRGMHIGWVYSKGATPVDWDSKVIIDQRGCRGAASSCTMKFLVERLLRKDTSVWVYDVRRVVEPFMHKSAQLPLWTRRTGVHYVGYTSSKHTFVSVKEKLDQFEIPGIQQMLPAT